METLRFVDLFAGLGGFRLAMERRGHECVFSSEVDPELRQVYEANFRDRADRIGGDILECRDDVPRHDVLCAGFPCQPFSKSGYQHGRRERRGNLFHHIVHVLERRKPSFVFLENVGNFEVHAGGRTWQMVQSELARLGYTVRATTHVSNGGHGLISPHHLGYPQHRERFYIVASRSQLPSDPFPPADRKRTTSLETIIQPTGELTPIDAAESRLTEKQVRCIDHWNAFLRYVPADLALPSFPMWGDELWEDYPYDPRAPWSYSARELRSTMRAHAIPAQARKRQVLDLLPSYARSHEYKFPKWKVRFIAKNRKWFSEIRSHLPRDWVAGLRAFPASLRKLEWHCSGEERDLWQKMLQFRPSGLRAKRYTSSPALVAMTATQIPLLGPERRFLTRTEGLRLQDFPDDHALPKSRDATFQALGNAVHVGVAEAIARRLLHEPLRGFALDNGRSHGNGDDGQALPRPIPRVRVTR
jgi:DNA (cytosine-5)-methyltransferase 1